MNKNKNILIIDDHQIIIDTYNKVLNFLKESNDGLEFNVYEAKDCDFAFQILQKETIDFIFLDIQLPSTSDKKFVTGESLGIKIRQQYPEIKIIVCTSLNDNLRLTNIVKTINPEGFLIKSDIGFIDLVNCTKKVLSNQTYFSQTIIELLRKRVSSNITLDDYDITLLHEMSNGARMKELVDIIPLSKAGIEKRKQALRTVLNLKNGSDREMVLTAREKGFI